MPNRSDSLAQQALPAIRRTFPVQAALSLVVAARPFASLTSRRSSSDVRRHAETFHRVGWGNSRASTPARGPP